MGKWWVLTAVAFAISLGAGLVGGATSAGQSPPVVLNTPDENRSPRSLQCRERLEGEEILSAFQEVLQASSSTDSQRAEELRHVYPQATTFQFWELPACQLLLRRRITDQQYLEFIDKTVPLLVPQASLAAPELQEPKEDAVFDQYPRRTAVSWKAVPTAAKYALEVQVMTLRMGRRGDGSLFRRSEYWAAHNDGLHHAEVVGTSAIFHFIGAQRGRLRVRAVAANGETRRPAPPLRPRRRMVGQSRSAQPPTDSAAVYLEALPFMELF